MQRGRLSRMRTRSVTTNERVTRYYTYSVNHIYFFFVHSSGHVLHGATLMKTNAKIGIIRSIWARLPKHENIRKKFLTEIQWIWPLYRKYRQIESRVIRYLPSRLCNWPRPGRPDDLSQSSRPFSPGSDLSRSCRLSPTKIYERYAVEMSAKTYGGQQPWMIASATNKSSDSGFANVRV